MLEPANRQFFRPTASDRIARSAALLVISSGPSVVKRVSASRRHSA
jgi:hypothetical protein